MEKYEIIVRNEMVSGILRTIDGALIPIDESNSDYQEYLAWVSEQELVITAP